MVQRSAKASLRRTSVAPRASTNLPTAPPISFPIIGVGASAGGIEACTQLLRALPGEAHVAVVVVQHLDPTHESILPALLSRVTSMPVEQVKDGMVVEPNHVYVVPPNVIMTIVDRTLRLTTREQSQWPFMPIDQFFRSLAADSGSQAVGIVLSGSGSDGALGLAEIKERGGIAFVQDEKTAKFAGMPRSAIELGAIDFVLPPEGIAKELARIAQHPYVASPASSPKPDPFSSADPETLGQILKLLRRSSGVDFASYKHATIIRRITRRVMLRKMLRLEEYLSYLNEHPEELTALYHDLLIKVTSFFREPDSFDLLKRQIIPALLKDRPAGKPIRIWVPGCATGEEAYSIAMVMMEALSETARPPALQLFATDIDEIALQKARNGVYLESIALDVSPERLQRFFTKVDHTYRISKAVREVCTFARHNLYKDPPFSGLDLVSCRNVMIYLEPSLQRHILPTFHYALNPTGFLILGTSETVGTSADLFSTVDKRQKVYAKRATAIRPPLEFRQRPLPVALLESGKEDKFEEPARIEVDVQKESDRATLNYCAPSGVLINDQMDILQFRGDTSHYLLPAPGKASLNIVKMARDGLLTDLRLAMEQAKRTGVAVKRKHLTIGYENISLDVTIHVIPLKFPAPAGSHMVVLFEESGALVIIQPKGQRLADRAAARQQDHRFQEELKSTKQYLEGAIEERDATNEELKSANEEVLSSNEELQSTNEELETAREELQSTNEELTTVNEELLHSNQALSQANNDLNNLFSNAALPILLLGRDLRIRRFTPSTERVLSLIPTDVGRPIADLQLNVHIPDLKELIRKALDTGSTSELEVQDREGCWYSLRIQPYKTSEQQIEGVVLRFIDIHSLKDVARLTDLLEQRRRAEEAAQVAQHYAESIVETVHETCLVVLDGTLRVKTASRSFYETFNVKPEETEGRLFSELGSGQWNIPRLGELLEQVLPQKYDLREFEVDDEFPQIGRRIMLLHARQLDQVGSQAGLILVAIEDITERRQAERVLQHSEERLRGIIEHSADGILLLDAKGKVLFLSPSVTRILGYTHADAVGRIGGSRDLPDDRKQNRQRLAEVAAQPGRTETFETRVQHKDGSWRWVECTVSNLLENPAVGAIVVNFHDITQMKASLTEKEILLKEIHHRVKNNLQIIWSLLNMQADDIRDPQALQKFKDSQDRIRSMSLIHERLYMSQDLARVDFDTYIRNLAASLSETYKRSTSEIKTSIEIKDVRLSIDRAIPCGLILNEVLSNAFKHAFPPGRPGQVLVRMGVDAERRITLMVRDTGIGLPAGLDIQKMESFGLRIVKALADQLGGTLRWSKEGGTTFTLTFPETPRAPGAPGEGTKMAARDEAHG